MRKQNNAFARLAECQAQATLVALLINTSGQFVAEKITVGLPSLTGDGSREWNDTEPIVVSHSQILSGNVIESWLETDSVLLLILSRPTNKLLSYSWCISD